MAAEYMESEMVVGSVYLPWDGRKTLNPFYMEHAQIVISLLKKSPLSRNYHL